MVGISDPGVKESINSILPQDKQLNDNNFQSAINFNQDFLTRILELQSQTDTEYKENMNLSKQLLDIALKDIKACRLLYNEELYSHSVYFLQQAIEKLTKSFGLALFFISQKDLRDISHKTPMAFVKLLNEKWAGSYIKIMKSFYPNLNDNVNDLEKLINKSALEIAKSSKEQIQVFVNLGDNLRNMNNEEMQNQVKNQIEAIVSLFSQLLQQDERAKKGVEHLKNNFDLTYVVDFTNLYLLSSVTYPHEEFTRYPDKDIKPEDYTIDTGIVQMALDICTRAEQIGVRLDKYLGRLKNG